MAITQTKTLMPELHSELVVFRDHFGHEHKVVVPTHIAKEDTNRPFPVGPVEIKAFDAQLGNIEKMMRDRELAFLNHCMENGHAQHPLVLSHPDHPANTGKAVTPAVEEKDCGCGPK